MSVQIWWKVIVFVLLSGNGLAQAELPATTTFNSFLTPADTFHRGRFWLCTGTATTLYTGTSVGLWHLWYKDYPTGSFRTFNDWGEWNHVDKMGHLFTAYQYSRWAHQGARWTGLSPKSSRWTAFGIGMGLQATIEVMDGFSENWGFSIPDVVFNTVGSGAFVAQDLLWNEQRISFKVSNRFPNYSTDPIMGSDGQTTSSLDQRANELYGTTLSEIFLKDYNGQTTWVSVNIAAFCPQKPDWLPNWLNIAGGYGADNLFGGYENSWTKDGVTFTTDAARIRQYYVSLDVDLTRIETKIRVLKTLFHVFNFVKIPSPTLALHSDGTLHGHAVYW